LTTFTYVGKECVEELEALVYASWEIIGSRISCFYWVTFRILVVPKRDSWRVL